MRWSRFVAAIASVLLFVARSSSADVYRWTDENGRTHFDDDAAHVPEAQREHARVFQMKARPAEEPGAKAEGPTQAAFAAGLARELGLQTSATQDPVSVLHLVGIYPAAGWYPAASLLPAVVQEVVTATRNAARARRLAQPEVSAEAAALRVASALGVATPPPSALPEPAPPPPPQILVAPNIVVQVPPPMVIVEHVHPAPQPVLSDYPTFAYGIPFAPLGPVPVGPIPSRITPLSNPAGRLHGPLIEPLKPGPFRRPLAF
jgi:hypothetical protein